MRKNPTSLPAGARTVAPEGALGRGGVSRRGFFALLAAAVADPERLVWVPGRKRMFIPAIPVAPAFIARETLLILENNLRLASLVTADFDRQFTWSGITVGHGYASKHIFGDTLPVRRPRRFRA